MRSILTTLTAPAALVAFACAGCASQTPNAQEPTMQTTQTTADRRPAPSALPAAAAVVTHEVNDYATWKRAFDEHAGARKRAGIVGTHINVSADNPNLVSVYLAAGDLASLRAFLGNDDLKATMMKAGVKGPPTVALITPVEDQTVRDRPVPGAIVIHRVASYDAWKKVFDGGAPARTSAGIIGHAVNRGVDDPNVVVVYLQSTTLDQVRNFTASPDLKETMMKAGVEGAPKIAFVQGAEWGS
jgi:hypothetical protein